nr:PTS glucose/sucrose transporter subunit IIB [Phytoactinopolyspora endophytica]
MWSCSDCSSCAPSLQTVRLAVGRPVRPSGPGRADAKVSAQRAASARGLDTLSSILRTIAARSLSSRAIRCTLTTTKARAADPPGGHRALSAFTSAKGTGMSNAEQILAALGGADNIVEIEPCITRLRAEVDDPSLVNEAGLKAAGAHGVVKAGTAVQVVVGPEADTIASDIEDLM